MLLAIVKIRATPEAQPRVSLHYPTVEQYADAIRDDEDLPPLVVFFDGEEHWLADGFHRLEAYKMRNFTDVPVDIRKGTKRDAILYSVGANHKHGLPRSPEDKRRAIVTLLKDSEWGAKSDAWIAEHCHVTDKTVAAVRAELEKTSEIPRLQTREGKDGKVRKLPERKPKSEPPSEPRPSAQRGEASEVDAKPESERRSVESERVHEADAPTDAAASIPEAPEDPKRGCASITERDAIEGWLRDGQRIFGQVSEGGRDYMFAQWAKIVKRLEGYAA